MVDTAVVWFRDDLRLYDNETLARAVATAERVVPLYLFDPRTYGEGMFGLPGRGPYWTAFRRESVLDLRSGLRERGGDLLVRHGDPREVVPEVAESVGAEVVHAQSKPATEEWATENAVRSGLARLGVPLESSWTHTLYGLEDLPTPVDRIDDTFMPWRKEVEREASVRDTVPTPETVRTPAFDAGAVPTLADLGVEGDPTPDDRGVLAFEGGETAGLRRLREYVWEGDHLRTYKRTRNGLLGPDYSSKLSPWLAHGCLSPRYVHGAVTRYEDERVANEDTYWLVFELLWRDFFQFQFRKHGGAFFTQDGIRGVEKRWRDDHEAFRRWAEGETGVPFVDANMRELNATGYMSNRGRQNVASFLADFLEVDWRMGAAHFESLLVDYDVASNWGNWAYQAGVGNDSRDSYFYVPGQAERYDGDAAYVTHWIPELEPLPPQYAHYPWRMNETVQAEYGVEVGLDYPAPMVDPNAQYGEMR